MKLILKVISILLLSSIALFSCKKDKAKDIEIKYLTENVWVFHRLFSRDLSGNEIELTTLWFEKECAKNNTHTYLSNQVYINFEGCNEPTFYDTMYWQYNEELYRIGYYHYRGYSGPENLYWEMEIEKLNETELILISFDEVEDEGWIVNHYKPQ